MIEAAVAKVAGGEMQGYYYSQSGYPSQLNDLGEPPPVLFSSCVIRPVRFAAVVGARKLSAAAIAPAHDLVRQLVSEGYAIVSGGAEGADAVALQESLDLGAYTAAVFATGLDVVYPAVHVGLFEKFRQAGVLLTEMMPGARPQRSFFPARNRIIAALADVVAVVQAGESSGSLITAAWASRLGRRILVLPPPTDADPAWAGNHRLIEAGAGVFRSGGKAFSVAEPVKDFFAAGDDFFAGF
jgi:DNA processing protein